MQPTKEPTREYTAYSDTPWAFWDVLYARRSHRKYLPMEPSSELLDSLREVVSLSTGARGARPDSIALVTEPGTVDRIKKRAYKGLVNKINIWLARTPVSGFMLLVVDRVDVGAERPRELPLATMAMEDCVLWLAERGLGTCWLAGINAGEIMRVMGLEGERTIPVAIPFGRAKPKVGGADFDTVIYRTLSRKRKPLEDIAGLESDRSRYRVKEIPRERFSAAPVQDVRGLLERISGESGTGPNEEVPLDLAIDACLESARIAPNGGNFQAWRFVAVRETSRLDKLALASGSAGGWRAAIVGAGATRRFESGLFDKPFWMIDVPIALSHISLMAASMGCGVEVCVNGMDEGAVNELAGFAGGVRPVGVVGLR